MSLIAKCITSIAFGSLNSVILEATTVHFSQPRQRPLMEQPKLEQDNYITVDAKSGHTLERARTRSKIVKMINTSSLPTPTG